MLPNFKKIIDEGFSSTLKETIPPVTIPSWPCLFSGMTPSQLGYCWFNNPEKGLFSSYNWRDRSLFSKESLKMFVLNVPGTYPAWEINGEMITGMMSPSIDTFPPQLKKIIAEKWIINGKSIREIFEAFQMKKKIFLEKLSLDFDLLTYVIRMPDSLSHHTHLDRNHISNYLEIGYKKIDDFLGEIIERYEFDNLFIFSDHGLKFYNHEFYITNWLIKKGLVRINKSFKQKSFSIIAKLYDIIRPIVKIDYNAYKKLKNGLLRKIIIDTPVEEDGTRNDSQETRALAFSSNVGGLYLNQKDKVKKEKIIELLRKERKVDMVIPSEIKGFPDLFIILNAKYLFNHHSSLFTVRRCNSINHSSNGFFMAYGKNIIHKKGNCVNYNDIIPTLLKLYKTKLPEYMTGKVLDIFNN